MLDSYKSFTHCYHDLVNDVYDNPEYICAPRGMEIREKLAVRFRIDDPRNRLVYIPERKYSVAYMLGELLWIMAGMNDVHWIATYSPFWLGVTDDGKTSSSAPGYRIFKKHPRIDNGSHIQYERVRDELKRDPDSRRAIFYLAMPTDHFQSKLDIGCALSSQMFIRDGKLNQVVTMRSSDLMLGLPYDVGILTMLQEVLAFDLGVDLGWYVHTSASEHIYDRDKEMALATKNAPLPTSCPPMPAITSMPPIDVMVEFESQCRKAETQQDIEILRSKVNGLDIDECWKDWCRIYVGHRAKRVCKELRKEIYQSCTFEGYRNFKK